MARGSPREQNEERSAGDMVKKGYLEVGHDEDRVRSLERGHGEERVRSLKGGHVEERVRSRKVLALHSFVRFEVDRGCHQDGRQLESLHIYSVPCDGANRCIFTV